METERKSRIAEKLTTYLFYLSILFFLVAFNFQDSRTSGWYQQFLPNPIHGQLKDIYFVDSLLGFAISDSCILKTTNGGDNWSIKLYSTFFTRIKFLNSSTGIASDAFHIHKTTNSGENWITLTLPGDLMANDMSVLNEDTIWICNSEGLVGGAFLTTDGGLNWQVKYSQSGGNPSHIYMFNSRIGFIGGGLKKTTDGGNTWISITGEGDFTDMYFIDSLTGWKAYGLIKKTTNGGLNWINQPLPQGGYINLSQMTKFTNVNRDSIWGIGGRIAFPNNQFRGIIYFTSNGGNNWYYQLPDTSINVFVYLHNKFINKFNGWAYAVNNGIHTITGGDSGFVMSTKLSISNIPDQFKLEQNYPNPFNPKTVIGYSLLKNGYIKLIVYDILGKEVATLVNENKKAGKYQTQFSINQYINNGSSTGIYFYSLFVDGVRVDTKKAVLLK